MKSTTVRFAEPVYRDLEAASRTTGLPINSIVTVACLEWLNRNLTGSVPVLPRVPLTVPWRSGQLRRAEHQLVRLVPEPLTGTDPLMVFTVAAQEALGRAQEVAERDRRPWIGTDHLLLGLAEASEGRASRALARLGVDAASLAQASAEEAAEQPERLLPTRQVRRAMRRAQEESEHEGAAQIGTDHLLLGLLLERDGRVAEALEAAGVTEAALREALRELDPED